jgi:lipoprotein-anchoring transpeptidase ErfK/SrfK
MLKRLLKIALFALAPWSSALAGQVQIIGDVSSGNSGSGGYVIGAISQPGIDLSGHAKRTTSIVTFNRGLPPGSIVVDTEARYLYFVMQGNKAKRYPVGVGREGYEWRGTSRISNKKQWPDWRPPQNMITREAERGNIIPAFVKGGPDNPLGARALYLGNTEYRIHGTTQPRSIGRAVSSGCIRMLNAHVTDLYNQVKIGALVIVE